MRPRVRTASPCLVRPCLLLPAFRNTPELLNGCFFFRLAIDKQKLLLSADAGHFSLIRALHLADAITVLNGSFRPLCPSLNELVESF